MNAKQAVRTTRMQVVQVVKKVIELLDQEQVRAFQGVYYLLFMFGATLIAVVPQTHSGMVANIPGGICPNDDGYIDSILQPTTYGIWTAMNILCPIMTIIGRRLTTLSAKRSQGESNPAFGAAWLQLTGDLGVWSGVNIFVITLFRLDPMWWIKDIYVAMFLLMGVLGGMMFTVRSGRRLMQIKIRDHRASKHGWG